MEAKPARCPACRGARGVVSNPDWPRGDGPYWTPCGDCGATGLVPAEETPEPTAAPAEAIALRVWQQVRTDERDIRAILGVLREDELADLLLYSGPRTLLNAHRAIDAAYGRARERQAARRKASRYDAPAGRPTDPRRGRVVRAP